MYSINFVSKYHRFSKTKYGVQINFSKITVCPQDSEIRICSCSSDFNLLTLMLSVLTNCVSRELCIPILTPHFTAYPTQLLAIYKFRKHAFFVFKAILKNILSQAGSGQCQCPSHKQGAVYSSREQGFKHFAAPLPPWHLSQGLGTPSPPTLDLVASCKVPTCKPSELSDFVSPKGCPPLSKLISGKKSQFFFVFFLFLNDRLTGTSANPHSAPNILRETVYSINGV